MMMTPDEKTEFEQKLILELRRGLVSLAALGALRSPTYGYSLRQRLVDAGFDIDQGTLYPLLRRLDAQGLLESDWNVEGNRSRKYYRLSPDGAALLGRLKTHWDEQVEVLNRLFANPEGDES